jgi:nanoRNase/pAp phosphatase (c-di-AMP/oligoRNAs hydrolase)
MAEEGKYNLSILEAFFDVFPRGGSLLILTHNHPDPDSIASAAALKEIAAVLGGAKSTLAYGGILGRSENIHMVHYLGLHLKSFDRLKLSDFDKVALVDTQPKTGNNALPNRVIPDLVVDHHPIIAPTRKVPFAEIRPEYGATATILAEYLFRFGLEVDRNLATALLYGIKSETQDLGREAHEVDIESYLKLFPIANKRLLAKIVNSRVPLSYFRFLVNAIQNAHVAGNAVVTRLADVDNPDIIPEFADLMLRLQGTVWAFCIGDFKESIYLSIRTTNVRKNAGTLMRQLVKGKGSGGGHGQIAGGKIDVPGLEPWQVHELEDEIEADFLRLIRRSEVGKEPLLAMEEDDKRKVKISI